MCRSIKVLRRSDGRPSEQELQEAALQYVRKISGYRVPSQANTVAFESAVEEVTNSSRRLLDGLSQPRRAAKQATPDRGRSRVAARA
jgi:hypothetical protein